MTPLQRLADLYNCTRRATMSADDHAICLQHAQELEKLLVPAAPAEEPAAAGTSKPPAKAKA